MKKERYTIRDWWEDYKVTIIIIAGAVFGTALGTVFSAVVLAIVGIIERS